MGEVRFEPEVKGHVKEGPDFGGNEFPGTHAPWTLIATLSFPRAPREERRGEGVGRG